MLTICAIYFIVSNSAICFDGFRTILRVNSINHLIVAMVKCGVLFEVQTEYLNNI
jgi:hypothetical protein